PGARAVELADTHQPPHHVGDVRAEHPTVVVQFVQYDVLQVLEQAHPLGVVGQHAGVQHVGVGYDDVPGGADQLAGVGGRVAVVGVGLDVAVEGGDDGGRVGG